MPLDLARPARIPVEFVGLARAFRSEVLRIDKQMDCALATLTAPLRARLARHPRLRHEMIAGTTRLYGMMVPAAFRIGAVKVMKDRAEFCISEARLTATWLHDDAWGDAERESGVALCRFVLVVHDRRLREHWHPMAIVSLHALARRVERSSERDHDALLRDLSLLVDTGDVVGERIDTPNGFWLGRVTDARDRSRTVRVRSVRTWISDG